MKDTSVAEEVSNILKFPKDNKRIVEVEQIEQVQSEATTGIALVKANHIHETLATIIPLLFNNIDLAGFNLDDKVDEQFAFNEGTMVIESIKSLLCKYYDIYHPFQAIADNVFVPIEGGEEDELQITKSLNLVLRPDPAPETPTE